MSAALSSIASCHVIDPDNIGDLLSAPAHYFTFPGFKVEPLDIRSLQPDAVQHRHVIVGGGGLLFPRFLNNLTQLVATSGRGKLIAWGIGQQLYGNFTPDSIRAFDYAKYLADFDLVGVRDFGCTYDWVPCASCLHPAFDRQRPIQHEFVVFSHKKFQLKIEPFPHMTHEVDDFAAVLDFLASGETILTSSYHGAYWGTLLGRKVLAFPFSSKFYTLKHLPGLHSMANWQPSARQFRLFNRVVYQLRYKNKYTCNLENWQAGLQHCQTYPESLSESRAQNQAYYAKVMDLLMS